MGHVSDNDLADYFKAVKDIEGDVAEIGVDRGYTFRRLVRAALKQNKVPHAFDSFRGMDEPGEHDDKHYHKHKFDQGGVENFRSWIPYEPNLYQCHEGYIPVCFDKYDQQYPEGKFSLVVLDVDHYQPTVDGLNWVWPKLSKGAILILDDFFDSQREIHASRAIHEWVNENKDKGIFEVINQTVDQLHVKKL